MDTNTTSTVTLTIDELNALIDNKLAEQNAKHAEELAAAVQLIPQNTIPQFGAGPSVNNIRKTWSLVEQEMARAGNDLPHWHDK